MKRLNLAIYLSLIGVTLAWAAATQLPNLTQGTTPPKYFYGTDSANSPFKYNGLQIKNVLDYGALCDGSTDDAAAIQAAVNDTTAPFTSANRGVIWFPKTVACIINSSITFELSAGITAIGFAGVPGAAITGNFSGALLKRSVNSPTSGTYFIRDLILTNNHATGICALFHSIVGGSISNIKCTAWRGFETYNSQSVKIDTVSLLGPAGTTSIGIVAGNATNIYATDISGYAEGVRHQNVGLVVSGGRMEVNTIGIRCGIDESGAIFASTAVHLSGISMEANQTAIQWNACTGTISGVQSGAGVNLVNGLNITGGVVSVENSGFGTSMAFSGAGVNMSGGTAQFKNITVTAGSGTLWTLPSDKLTVTCLLTNAPACAEIPFTVFGSLPACSATTLGQAYLLSNANTNTAGATVTTTGALQAKVRCVNGTGYVVGGWLLKRDMPNNFNDNTPMWLNQVA